MRIYSLEDELFVLTLDGRHGSIWGNCYPYAAHLYDSKSCMLCVQSLRCVQLFAIPWTIAGQAPLSMEFSRQEYQSGLPFHSSWTLPNPGTEVASLVSPALAGGVFTTSTTWEVIYTRDTWSVGHWGLNLDWKNLKLSFICKFSCLGGWNDITCKRFVIFSKEEPIGDKN